MCETRCKNIEGDGEARRLTSLWDMEATKGGGFTAARDTIQRRATMRELKVLWKYDRTNNEVHGRKDLSFRQG